MLKRYDFLITRPGYPLFKTEAKGSSPRVAVNKAMKSLAISDFGPYHPNIDCQLGKGDRLTIEIVRID